MKFCSECAHPVVLAIPEGDNRPRYVCTHCNTIHYQNPKLVVGSIPVWERDGELQILLCKRAIEPRYGYWTLPAGFMENEETTEQAAQRETEEEAGANVELGPLFSLLNVAHVHQVHLFYRRACATSTMRQASKASTCNCSPKRPSRGTTWHSPRSARRWNCSLPTGSKCARVATSAFTAWPSTAP